MPSGETDTERRGEAIFNGINNRMDSKYDDVGLWSL